MTPLTDTILWERTQAGDPDAFGDLYERHARAVQAYCLWRTADAAAAEDLTATVFLEAWRKRRSVSLTTPSARPFLLGVATNVVRSHWRSRRRHAAAIDRMRGATANASPAHDDDAIERLDALRKLAEVRDAVRRLPRRELDVLALVACSELTYEETAAALGVPVGTVRSRLARARSRLAGAAPAVLPSPLATKEPTT
jgi:RNA polymerase sigma-70 factor, ECF subfamily